MKLGLTTPLLSGLPFAFHHRLRTVRKYKNHVNDRCKHQPHIMYNTCKPHVDHLSIFEGADICLERGGQYRFPVSLSLWETTQHRRDITRISSLHKRSITLGCITMGSTHVFQQMKISCLMAFSVFGLILSPFFYQSRHEIIFREPPEVPATCQKSSRRRGIAIFPYCGS